MAEYKEITCSITCMDEDIMKKIEPKSVGSLQ